MNNEYKNVLITGGAGNLGRHAYYNLCKDYNCVLFDQVDPSQAREPWEPNMKRTLFVRGNLDNYGDCMRAIAHAKADVILHIAGLPFPTEINSNSPMRRMQRVATEDTTWVSNMSGTYYLLESAVRMGVKKVIFASSFFATGIGNRLSNTAWPVDKVPITEDYDCCPEDTYSYSKYLGEELLKAYSRAYGLKTIAFRLQGISYPYRPHLSPIQIPVMEKCKEGFFEGHTWQYVDARDVANAMRLAIEKDLKNGFEAFNIVTDKRYEESTADFAASHWPTIAAMCKELKGPEDRGLFCDKKLRDMLGYKEQYSWRQSKEYPGPGKDDPNDQ